VANSFAATPHALPTFIGAFPMGERIGAGLAGQSISGFGLPQIVESVRALIIRALLAGGAAAK
jgi:hypothetical protein